MDPIRAVTQYIYRFYGPYLRKEGGQWELLNVPTKQWRPLILTSEIISHVREVMMKAVILDLDLPNLPNLQMVRRHIEEQDPDFIRKMIDYWNNDFKPTK
jgi:hypothetical protein